MKKIILLITILFYLQVLSAQDYTQTVRGTVIDAVSKSPIPGANIFVVNSNPLIGAVSENDGSFVLKNVPIGKQDIIVRFMGYKPVYLPALNIKSGKELILNVEMTEMVVTTQEVVVKAYGRKDKALNEMAKVSARSFSVEETERYAGTWFDPARMASNYAGVMAAGDQRNDIIIRGNSPLALLWQLDGINIPNPNHFGTLGTTGGPISILNNNLLDNSDFFTGAFPAEYGNAIAGVFDLKMRKGNNKKHEYVAQVGMNGFELAAEGPFSKKSKASYLISYRYSTLAVFNALGINFGVSGIPQFQDLSFKLNFPTKTIGQFSLFGVGGISFIEVLNKDRKDGDWTFGHDNLDFRFGSNMGVTGLEHLYFFNKNTRLNSVIAISNAGTSTKADSAYQNAPSLNYYGDKSSEIKYSFTSKFSQKINAKNNYNIGLILDLYSANYLDSALFKDNLYHKLTQVNSEKMLLIQSYAQFQHNFNDKLTIYNGLHFQYFSLNNTYTVEPRFSIEWDIDTKNSISAGFGMHSQLQPRFLYFLETKTGNNEKVLTNKNMDFSKSKHYILSYNYLINNNLRLKVETYYQDLYNIPVEQKSSYYSIINFGNDFYSDREDSLVNKGSGKNYGIELTFEKFLSKNYYFLLTTSIFNSKYKGSDGIERNTIYNSKYVFNALLGYTFNIGKYHSLSIDLKTVTAGGKHYIPVNLQLSQLYDEKILDYSRAYEPNYPAYFRLDGRISFKLNHKKMNTEIALDVQNLSNHKNVLLETYDSKTASIVYDYQFGLFYVFLLRFQF